MNAPADRSPAQRWFALALEDIRAAEILLDNGSAALRIVGFLSQQAAEKALKAGLFAISVNIPKIHGLSQILSQYPPDECPAVDLNDLDELDPWIVDGRYAADLPDVGVAEANQLLEAARRIVDAVGVAAPHLDPKSI